MTGRWLDELEGRIKHGEGGRFFLVEAPLRYEDRAGDVWTVPAGFRCDLASVPRLLLPIALPWHRSARAGVLHDYLYLRGLVPRTRADALFREALIADDPANGSAACWSMWLAVRAGGWRAWRLYRHHGARRREWMTSRSTLSSDPADL